MGLSRNVILLESNLYERSAIISSIEQNSKTDKLSEVNTNLQSLIFEASTEIKNRIQQESESSQTGETFNNRNYRIINNTIGIETLDDARKRLENEGKVFFYARKD